MFLFTGYHQRRYGILLPLNRRNNRSKNFIKSIDRMGSIILDQLSVMILISTVHSLDLALIPKGV